MIYGANSDQVMDILFNTIKKLRGSVKSNEFQIMTGTIATESGFYQRVQIGGGPARGICQVEPNTAMDIYNNYLSRKPELYRKLMGIVFSLWSAPFFVPDIKDIESLLMYDDYCVLMARFAYLRHRPPIPDTLEGQAAYYKQYYNTPAGKGSVEKYMRDWESYECMNRIAPYITRMDTGAA